MTTEKTARKADTAGLGTPQGDPETTSAQLHEDVVRTRDNLAQDHTAMNRLKGKPAWSGAGFAGVVAGAVAALLWRRHTRTQQRPWGKAKRQFGAVAAGAKAGAKTGAGTAREQAKAHGGKAKAKAKAKVKADRAKRIKTGKASAKAAQAARRARS